MYIKKQPGIISIGNKPFIWYLIKVMLSLQFKLIGYSE